MKYSIFITCLFCFFNSRAQIGELGVNNTRIKSGVDGTFFYFQSFTPAGYIVPQFNSTGNRGTLGTIHSASLWMSAIDQSNVSHLSAVVRTDFGSDFTAGPVSNQPNTSRERYENIYEITSQNITDHIQNPNSTIDRVYNWPSSGNTDIGEPSTVAAFEDLNNNGIYEPASGEYPTMYGDKSIYSIYNDKAEQGFSSGSSMGLDIHQYIYQLENFFEGDTLENTNFARFMVINRSDNDYSDFKFGMYVNVGIGNFSDDYVGSDSTLNLAYGYNGDDNDEGVTGYGFNPPMQGAMFLNTSLASSTVILQNENEKDGLPSTVNQYTNYINGAFRDGSAKTIRGNNLTYTSKYDYPGNLNFEDDFSEGEFGNTPGDRNVLIVAKPAYIASGDTLIYDLAFPYARVGFGGATGAYDSLINLAKHITKRYNSDHSWIDKAGDNRGSLSIKKHAKAQFTVYPNPSSNLFTIKGLQTDKQISITDMTGKTIKFLNANTRTFSLRSVEPGVYFLKTSVGSVRLLKL
jgi:hypothetical protein